MAQYSFVAQNREGRELSDLSPMLRDREITMPLNRPATVKGTLNLESPRASIEWLESGVHELKVYRDGVALETVFRLVDVTVNAGIGGGTLSLTWESISTYLKDLVVPTSTTPITDAQSDIAWYLIDTALAREGAGVYDINRGAIPSVDPSKTVTYERRVDVLTAIERLAQRQDGFDFAVDADRNFNVYYPWRGQATDVVLNYPGSVISISFNIATGPGRIATDLTGVGVEGRQVTVENDDARTKYGRRESFPVYSEVSDNTTLLQYATEDLAVAKQPIIVPTISVSPSRVPYGQIELGDIVKLQAKLGATNYMALDNWYRITTIKINPSNEIGDEEISYELNEARIVGVS